MSIPVYRRVAPVEEYEVSKIISLWDRKVIVNYYVVRTCADREILQFS